MLFARERVLHAGSAEAKLQSAAMADRSKGDLHDYFKLLMGFPLTAFDSHGDLDFLQCLASAIRHGDRASARRVHELCLGLWWNWIDPYETLVESPFTIPAAGAEPKHPSFSSITAPQALLEQMIQSVLWFWEDLDNLRCASFNRKHHTVVHRLQAWPGELALRESKRVWSASKPLG